MRLLALIFLLAITNIVSAQTTPHRCNADENHQYHYDNDQDYRHDFDVRKVQLDAITASSQNQVRLACTNPIIIPVAVHYEGVGTQTAACLEALALSQIAALNADYSSSNPDIANYCVDIDNSTLDPAALAANGACIQFCLANQNHPAGFGLNDGDYAVTINEDYVANNNFPNFTNGVWAGYMNMFVTEGTGVLGYAPLFGQANGDGVVIEACAFGVDGSGCGGGIGPGAGCSGLSVYNLGRTVTHEVGHYLGLEHIWGGGAGGCGQDDGIADTPVSTQEYYGCPTQGSASCGSDDMYMNYMDYTNDACMYMFSEGQATVMFNTASTLWTTNSSKCLANPSYPLATLPSGCNAANDDVGITAHVTPTPNSATCAIGTSVTPVVTLQNFGANTLTSVTISYEVNSGTAVNFSWTGSLATGLTEDVTLAPYNEPAGVYEFKSYTSNPNNTADENAANDELATNHETIITINLPYQEDFEDGSFDPTNSGLTVSNPDNDAFAWESATVSANGLGTNSAIFDNFSGNQQSNPGGTTDALNTPVFDFSNVAGATLTFDVAYAQYDANNSDGLTIMVSTDCGENYNQMAFQDTGTGLATAPDNTNAFIPSNTEWNNISVDLSAYDGESNVSVSFINDSGWGNNLYVDNINISTSTSSNCAATATSTGVSCAGMDGTATAASTNIVGVVNYEWSNGQSGITITGLVPNTYTVTITDADNCVATASVVVEDDCGCGNMVATSTVINNVSCFGECDGLATVAASGGDENYTYLWSNGATQPTEDNLCAGTYTVTVSDSDGCTAVTDLVITEPSDIGLITSATSETCAGNDGSAQATTTGTGTYTFLWNNGIDTPDNIGIVAGTYTVTVTDMNTQCTATETVIVGNDCGCGNMLAFSQVINNVSCFGECDGVATVSATAGNGNYTYLWSNGATQATEDGLCAGTYTITVSDSDGCTAVTDFTITEPAEIGFTTASSPETCAGNDGSAQISSVGIAVYTYTWSNGVNGPDNLGIEASTYTITVTDINTQCTASETVIVENDCNTGGCDNSTLSYFVNNIMIAGCSGVCGGAILGTGDGGTAPYTYLWSNGQTTDAITALCTGDYTVTVTDAVGCTYDQTIFVEEHAEVVLTVATTTESCAGNDGTATATIGGNATFIWSNGFTDNAISGLAAGTYTVTATDVVTQCTATQTVIVENDCTTGGCDNSTLTYFVNNIMIAGCSGVCGGAILGTGDGGTAPYTYLWSNGQTTDAITALCAGDYTVTVTDAAGCTYDQTIFVEEHAEVVLTVATTTESCAGNDGTATATIGGNATFIWSNGFTDNAISGLAAGTYTVTATDVLTQCTATETMIVGNGCNCNTILAESQVISNVSCFGECDGFATISASGGTGTFTYLWDNGFTQPTEDNLCAGTYVVTVSDSDGCTAITDLVIGEPDPIMVTTTSTPESCATDDGSAVITNTNGGNYTYVWSDGNTGDTNSNIAAGIYVVTITDVSTQCTATETIVVGNNCGCDGTLTYFVNNLTPTGCSGNCDGSIGGIADGGTAPYTYLWSDGQTVDSPIELCEGNYTVTVADANGCTYSETFLVEESTGFTIAANASPETCAGNDGTGFVTSSGTNVTYEWSNGESGNVVDGLSAGTYMVTATDGSGCTSVATVVVEEDCGCDFIVVEITVNNPSCANDCNGSALAESDIPNGAIYEWCNGETGSVITNLCAGVYTVTATDAEGCTGISSVVINDPNPIELIMNGSDSDCGAETGSVSVSIIGGTAPFTYNWNNGNTDGFQEGLNSGTYAVTVTDVNGCEETGSITITGSPSIAVIGQVTNVSCGGESDGAINVTVTGGTPPYTYDWDNGEATENLSGIPAGTYVLFVTDAEGCATGTSFTVSGAPELMINMQVTGNSSILAGTTGGVAPYTWQWSNGESGVFIDELNSGDYTVVVTDANGCTAEATATIFTTSTLDPSLVTDWSVYPNPSNGLFQLSMDLTEKEDISISLINILGQTIFMAEENTDDLNQTIDIQEFSKGTYFLEIRVKDSRVVEKLMLVK